MRDDRIGLARVLVPVAGSSAFLNNTPIVAMVAPAILTWARRTGRSASKYLLPVSFATILGGTITVIGTSTNLVVSGLLESYGERARSGSSRSRRSGCRSRSPVSRSSS